MSDAIKPTLGRTVLFTLESGPSTGQQRPAIVVATDRKDPGLVTLQVFTDGDGAPNVGDGLPGVFRQAKVPFSEEPKPGSWSWPTKVEPAAEKPAGPKKGAAVKQAAEKPAEVALPPEAESAATQAAA